MKIQCILSGCLFLFTLPMAFAQQSSPGNVPPQRPGYAPSQPLTKFDLDFRGGTPKELAAAIQEASGRPLNVIIPEEFADTKLPALKMKNVDVPQLFDALTSASRKQELVGRGLYDTSYGFRPSGQITDDTIWNFFVQTPPPLANEAPPKICRFYSLARYLDSGTTVDDITTAIKTGAQMLGAGPGPAISFHKDTKLLIAVGDEGKLQLIDSVLEQLAKGKTSVKDVSAAKSAEAGKR